MTAPHTSTLLNEPASVEGIEIPRPLVGGQRTVSDHAGATTVIGGTAEEQAQREDAAYTAGAQAATERAAARQAMFPVMPQTVAAPPTMAPRQYVPATAPMYAAPQPQVVYVAAPGRGNGLSALAMALIIVIIALVAGFAAYLITQQNAPSAQESARLQNLAASEAFLNGRAAGVNIGAAWGEDAQRSVAALNAKVAGERAYAKALAAGTKAGAASYKPSSFGSFGGYYRSPRYRGYGGTSLSQGLATAQRWANITNAPVDVEVY